MRRIHAEGRSLVFGIAVLLVACGGKTGDSEGSGGASSDGGHGAAATGGTTTGSGGSPSGTGGTTSIPSCTGAVSDGVPCSTPSANCVGPCSNSWQVENVCKGDTWQFVRVVPCGPDASHAPQCHNSFSGGSLTPCCASGGLDCAGKPDGYPGFGCTPGEGSFCSCTCSQGQSLCGC